MGGETVKASRKIVEEVLGSFKAGVKTQKRPAIGKTLPGNAALTHWRKGHDQTFKAAPGIAHFEQLQMIEHRSKAGL
jgi:hypothetical protein